jgi:hypothetical protein
MNFEEAISSSTSKHSHCLYIYLYAIVRYNSDKIFPYNVLNDMCYLLSFRQLISLSRPPIPLTLTSCKAQNC